MDKLPVEILLNIFSYLPTLEDGFRCSCVCRSWFHVLNSDSEVWEQLLVTSTPKEYHNDPLLNKLDSAKAKLIAFHCAWSSEDHSHNIRLNTNKLTLHRDPVAQSSDGIRGKRGFTRGVHYWTVTWHGPKFGSSSVVGVASKEASLQDSGYYALIGCDKESWGWDISQNVLRHDGVVLQDYPNSGVKVTIGQKIGVMLDMNNRTVAFDVDDSYLGIAFRDLPQCKLYPVVSTVYGHSEISLVYHGAPLVG